MIENHEYVCIKELDYKHYIHKGTKDEYLHFHLLAKIGNVYNVSYHEYMHIYFFDKSNIRIEEETFEEHFKIKNK